jgi:hypothetical protein
MMAKLVSKDKYHPDYLYESLNYQKWRTTYEAGDAFIEQYCEKYTQRESDTQFVARKGMTPNPAYAKKAVDDVKNGIIQRMCDITRVGGPFSYQQAILGKKGGVDRIGSSMNSFLAEKVLPELLPMRKVGIFVDRMPIDGQLLTEAQNKLPYIYAYKAEDILNWTYDDSDAPNEFTSLLLRDNYYTYDDSTGLPDGYEQRYRLLKVRNNRVYVQFFDDDGNESTPEIALNIERIPFVLFELPQSLLADISNYQIALMNMSSSDVSYNLLANYPFYTEQFDPSSEGQNIKTIDPDSPENPAIAKDSEIKVSPTVGRKYPKGTDRPDFIAPPTAPLEASMKKQDQLKKEILELVNLALSNISASAESKKQDQRGLESGLACIGMILQRGEQQIAEIWSMYESSKTPATVQYPERYEVRSEEEIREEIEASRKLLSAIPSKTFKKEIAKKIVDLSIGNKVSRELLEKIKGEIDAADDVLDNVEFAQRDLELGGLSPETYCKLRGYPEGESKCAEEWFARRAAATAEAQAKASGAMDQARGSKTGADPTSGRREKREARQRGEKQRGKGKAVKDA